MVEFMTVAKVSDVPEGERRRFDVGRTPVAVANVGGALYAFGNTCTHLGCSLAQGELDGTTVTCPCDGSRFDVTSGKVLRGPAREPAASYAVTVQDRQLRFGPDHKHGALTPASSVARRCVQGTCWNPRAELSPVTSYAVLPSKVLAMIRFRQAIKLKLASAAPRMFLA